MPENADASTTKLLLELSTFSTQIKHFTTTGVNGVSSHTSHPILITY